MKSHPGNENSLNKDKQHAIFRGAYSNISPHRRTVARPEKRPQDLLDRLTPLPVPLEVFSKTSSTVRNARRRKSH